MKSYLLFAVVSVLALGSCSDHTAQIKNAEWLIGTWENKTERGIIYETWIKINNVEFYGKSYILQDKDTIVFETIRLVEEQDSLFYIPTVENQNNALPVRFPSKFISENKLVFENIKHDFPQTISYYKIGTDSLIAEISGTKNGKETKQTFTMKRVK